MKAKAEPKFDHIGLAVRDMEKTLDFLTQFGVTLPPPSSNLSNFFKVRDCRPAGVKWALIPTHRLENAMIEPLEPTRESYLSEFLKTRGDMSVVEIAFRVDDIEDFYDRVKKMGMTPLDEDGHPLTDSKYFMVCTCCMPEKDQIKCFYLNIPLKPGDGPAIEILEYPPSWPTRG